VAAAVGDVTVERWLIAVVLRCGAVAAAFIDELLIHLIHNNSVDDDDQPTSCSDWAKVSVERLSHSAACTAPAVTTRKYSPLNYVARPPPAILSSAWSRVRVGPNTDRKSLAHILSHFRFYVTSVKFCSVAYQPEVWP